MAYVNYPYKNLQAFCVDAFEKFGYSKRESEIITDVLLLSDIYGIESHGMQRLSRYHKSIEIGMIKVHASPEVVFETPLSAVVDGHDGMGQLIGHYCMEIAIKKAKEIGTGFVMARNSNHYGIAGYYAKQACDEGLIGISFTNSAAIMVPTYGRRAMLGSNPIAVSMPADPYPFLFDASTTVVTRGKLEVYNKMEKPLPLGWALDAQGHDTADAADVLKNIACKAGGGIVPLGGSTEEMGSHKGYGFGIICEIFSSILSLGTTSNDTYNGTKASISHGFIAINPSLFGDSYEIKAHLSSYLEILRNSDKAEGQSRIYTHGEKEIEAAADRIKKGIPINDKTVMEMLDLCKYLDIDFTKYFGEYKAK
jgi:L-2-hydroxycarboxylate dehydrogenase (NAD+)